VGSATYKTRGLEWLLDLFNTYNAILQFSVALSLILILQFTKGRTSSSPFGGSFSFQPPGFRGKCPNSRIRLTSLPTVTCGTNCLCLSRTLKTLFLSLELFTISLALSGTLQPLVLSLDIVNFFSSFWNFSISAPPSGII
jgi:hypothetical protein